MFNQVIQQWFDSSFKKATDVQCASWRAIKTGKDVLICAPTGSGKTLAAFLYAINELYEHDDLESCGLKVLYISPLKALSNDININLSIPLEEIQASSTRNKKIKSAVWTGDTTSHQRNLIRKTPPHILVTTPESLYNILTSQSGRKIVKSIKTVIVDEIHAIAPNKRGAHLLLSLRRLEALSLVRPQRIAISATQKPIEKMRDYILNPQYAEIVDLGHKREMELSIELVQSPLSTIMSNEQWTEIYDALAARIKKHSTTLVFVNNRRLSERVAKHLAERLGEDLVTAHHGSLAKEHRLDAEQRLKAGQLKAIVATASLELGIDIGDVDLVCQLGSAGSIQSFLQRVGRSGHGIDRVPKGYLYPLTIDDLLEVTAIVYALGQGVLEHTVFPHQPLDVLAQQIVAEVSAKQWQAERLYHLFKDASIYQQLDKTQFYQVVEMLTVGYSEIGGFKKALLFYDAATDQLRPRKSAQLTALLNGGTIPDQFDYDVRLLPDDINIGSLNEDFSFESLPGDIFQLGNHSYRILKIETGTVFVEDAKGQPPNIPFWFGVQMWRSDELSLAVSQVREMLDDFHGCKTSNLAISKQMDLSVSAVEQLMNYVDKTKSVLKLVPRQDQIVVERFFDGNNDMHLVIHSVYGSRLNRAWGLALRKRFCRQFNFELQAAALEDSLILSLSSTHSFELETVMSYLHQDSVRGVLIQALLDTPFFVTQWRWNASIALAVKRRYGGKRVLPQFQRNDAEDLVAQVFPDQIACAENISGNRQIPDHPLVSQTIRDCTEVIMDISGLELLLEKIRNDGIKVSFIDSNTPSPTSLAIINARNFAFLDDAPAEERRTLAVQTQQLNSNFDSGLLDAQSIKQLNKDVTLPARNQDELHELIHYSGLFWPDDYKDRIDQVLQLEKLGRIKSAVINNQKAYYSISLEQTIDGLFVNPVEDAHNLLIKILANSLSISGHVHFEVLREKLPVSASLLNQALLLLETKGVVFKLKDDYWIERHNLAKLRKNALNKRRNYVKPVSPTQWLKFLDYWQYKDQRLSGPEGLSILLRQWQGYSTTAEQWEQQIITPRLKDYEPEMLDMLCNSGQFIWKRARASRVSSDMNPMSLQKLNITFLATENSQLYPAHIENCQLNQLALKIYTLLNEKGAQFFRQLVTGSGMMPLQLEQGLIQLIKNGLIIVDGFQAIRTFGKTPAMRRKMLKKAQKHGNSYGYMEMMGRWSVIPVSKVQPAQYIQLMLNRYGILCNEIFKTESQPINWREATRVLSTMEARGEVIAGRFITGMTGMQYALTTAYSQLKRI